MFSLSSLVMLIVYIVVAGVIFWLLKWLIDYVGIPDPFKKVSNVILAVVAVLFIIGLLLHLVGM